MGTHLIAFQQSVDQVALAAINNVPDDVLTRTGALRFVVPAALSRIWWAAALGVSLTRAQVITPSLQVRRMNPEIAPRRRGAALFTLLAPEIFLPPRPLLLDPGEEIELDTAEDGAGATQMHGLIALGPARLPEMPAGDIRIVRATGTTTLVAFAWSTVTLTLDSSLEAGTYAVVGFVAMSANAIAARLIITGQQNRPGLPAFSGAEGAAVDFEAALWNQLAFFDMGRFRNIELPTIQYFASVADTAETVYLYLIRVGGL